VARRNPARLVIALAIAAALAIFLLYTSIAGGGTPAIKPSELDGRTSKVQLVGTVVGPVVNRPGTQVRRFRLRDIGGKASVAIVYTGTVGDLFKVGQHILVTGQLQRGVFVAERDSMITKCPSKYIPKKSST
jgi:cytochrome c-type biogenesis protein CcmE